MAPKKTKYPKKVVAVHIESILIEFSRKISLERGCFHNKTGSASEAIRRGFKTWILKELPYLKKTMTDVDWNESY